VHHCRIPDRDILPFHFALAAHFLLASGAKMSQASGSAPGGSVLMMSLNRHTFIDHIQHGFQYTVETALAKDNHYTLFRREDWASWIIFSCVFTALIIFDNCVLNRRSRALTVARAAVYTLFWIACAGAFCGYVGASRGSAASFSWTSGYILEWMLSFDNLFVFHLIFTVYGTPENMKHKPLYIGICGAIFFRLLFIFIGEYLMHAAYFAHFVFGAFLVYTGIKTVAEDDDDEDPSQHPAVQWLQTRLPFVAAYDKDGRFFVRVAVDDQGEAVTGESTQAEANETDALMLGSASEEGSRYKTVDFAAALKSAQPGQQTQLRATMLFLVVCCLEVSDILFAVDSVSAIVAQVNDLYLAYTAAVFAMLGLRATFFIIDVLVQIFSLLKYGVAGVLVFIGIKLILSRVYNIPPIVVCLVLVLSLGSSMVASVIQDEFQKKMDGKTPPEIVKRVDHVCKSPQMLSKKGEKVPIV